MLFIGQPEPVKVELNSDVEIIFTIKEISTINSRARPCIERDDYSFTQCVRKFAIKKANCDIDYFAVGRDQQGRCKTENFFEYFKLLIWIKQTRLPEVIKESGCHPKCKISQYSYEKIHKRSHWNQNWTAEIYIHPKSSIIKHSSEYFTFDGSDLVGNIGGYLGLFLGWSLLTFVEALTFILCMFRIKKRKK